MAQGKGHPPACLAWTVFSACSVLVGRAAMYDMLTVFACYLAIVAGEVLEQY